MGRRPNAIVSEHFQRGEKIGDSSNRYAYTCRNCGEAFPKGRTDSLISHVTQRCLKISPEQRQHAVQSIQQLSSHSPEPPRQIDRSTSATIGIESALDSSVPQQTSALSREPSALDTLAEVSRRHLDFSSSDRHDRGHTPKPDNASGDQTSTDHLLIQELRKAANMPELPKPVAPVVTSSAGDDLIKCSEPLMQAASQANERLERAVISEPALDPRLDAHEQDPRDASMRSPQHSPVLPHHNGISGVLLQHANPAFGATAKARGRFSDTRRKQVSDIRKRGACIRCRMLKKPCSEGTPCQTCKGVESARLWKTSCIRTRLADEFGLWSAGLFYAKARISVPAAVYGRPQSQPSGGLAVRPDGSSTAYTTFPAKGYSTGLVGYRSTMMEDLQGVDPAIRTGSPHSQQGATEDIILLEEGEIVSTKIEEYIRQATSQFINQESSVFIRNTLERAQVLVELEVSNTSAAPVGVQGPRSSYSLQDQLLKNVIELWTATMILVQPRDVDLNIRHDPLNTYATNLNSTEDMALSGLHTDRTHSITTQSRDLITAQLLAATESRCSTLAKTVTNEIERRLLQRQQVSRASTFLSAIILLNSVERMSGLYWSLDPEPSSSVEDGVMPPGWPLDTSARRLWPQGENFADLLIMLLRMRGLPPKTTTTQDGHLVVVPDQPLRTRSDNGRTTGQSEEQTSIPAEWLDSLNLEAADLFRIRDDGLENREAGAGAFDLAFISKVLLPPSK